MTGQVLGILGGGQLGRMTALAAARIGARCVVLDPAGRGSPAGQVAWEVVAGAYDDPAALARLADLCDAATYEFENIPVETVRALAARLPVRPGARLLEVSQDRAAEKRFLNEAGIPTAPWRAVESAGDIPPGPGLLKTRRMGYDGKGQAQLDDQTNRAAALASLGGPAIWEGLVDFACEASVIVARDAGGRAETYGPARNDHAGGILSRSTVPAGLDPETETRALALATRLAQAVELVGVLALELFITCDGDILANEIAPRPHNSGHWTIDACAVSQFENHARTALGLPLAAPGRYSGAVMDNLVGPEGLKTGLAALEKGQPGVHLYGKDAAPPGRKIGHITTLTHKRS